VSLLLVNLRLPARLESLSRFIEAVSACGVEQGLNDKRLAELQLAVEEALVNVFSYAYGGLEGMVEVICLRERSNLVIEIVDQGMPFNPLEQTEPDVTADVGERGIGGLGILLIRKVMDDVRYRRRDGQNVLDLVVRLEREQVPSDRTGSP
jgi:serine/threonine-protein kinase RsbW